jgi:TRAP-type uncharacterized transport system fused permease subunit
MFSVYLLLGLLVLVFTLLLTYSTSHNLTITYENYDLQVTSTPVMLLRHLLKAGWIIMIPLGLLLAWLVMRYTHRIAGPLYKFETILEQMSRGVLDPQVRLRNTDDGQEVMVRFQEVNRFLVQKVGEMRGLTDRLQDEPTVRNSPELLQLVAELQKSLAEFEIRE